MDVKSSYYIFVFYAILFQKLKELNNYMNLYSMIRSICLVLTFCLFQSCADDKSQVDVSNIQPTFEIIRYDQMTAENICADWDAHGKFLELYAGKVLQVTSGIEKSKDSICQELSSFYRNPHTDSLNLLIQNEFSAINDVKKEIKNAYQHIGHYFGDTEFPDIYMINSGLNIGVFIFSLDNKDQLGIGLDFFLGDNFPYKTLAPMNNNFSNYLSRTFNRDHLTKKLVEVYLNDKLPKSKSNNLLNLMLHEGKKQYILERLLPKISDTVLWEYTPTQMDWVKDNELNIYTFLFSENLLYDHQVKVVYPLVERRPHSKGMPPEAPGRASVYIGYKIISGYMEKHPEMTLKELIQVTDGVEILKQSKYKPKRG